MNATCILAKGKNFQIACMQNGTNWNKWKKNYSLKITSARFQLYKCKLLKKQNVHAMSEYHKENVIEPVKWRHTNKKKENNTAAGLLACSLAFTNEKCSETNNSNFGKT